MADRKPTTLDDLDRDELLQFIRYGSGRLFLIRERDLVWAQWEVAGKRAAALRDQALAMYEEIKPLRAAQIAAAEALSKTSITESKRYMRLSKAFREADAALKAAEERQDKLWAQAGRLDRKEERLYQLHSELPR